jgi:uncharacterized membrane protein YccC
MITAHVLLMILAIICLFLAAIGVQSPRGNLLAAGLCLWAVAVTIG